LTQPEVKGCNSALFSSRTHSDETDLSALGDAAQAHPRISSAHADPRRAGGNTRAPRERARASGRLNAAHTATLPRIARLVQREQYAAALATGPARTRRYFILFVRPNGLDVARLGIIASKRIAQRAVDRNRAKRLVREAFRSVRHGLGGRDVVVQLRRRPDEGFNAAARAEIVRLLEELGAKPVTRPV
jgi:ribonuclease P protein component